MNIREYTECYVTEDNGGVILWFDAHGKEKFYSWGYYQNMDPCFFLGNKSYLLPNDTKMVQTGNCYK